MNERKKSLFVPNPNRGNKVHRPQEYTPEYIRLGVNPSDAYKNAPDDFKKTNDKNVRPVENKVQNQYREIAQNKGFSPFKRTAVPSKSQLQQSLNVGNGQEQVWKSSEFYDEPLSEVPVKDIYEDPNDFSDVEVPEEYTQGQTILRPKTPLKVESTTYTDELEDEIYFPEVSEGTYFVMYKSQFHQETFESLDKVEEFVNNLVFGSEDISLDEIQVFKRMEIKTGIFVK